MPERNSSHKKRPRDVNLLAKSVVDELTGETSEEEPTEQEAPQEPTPEERSAAAAMLGSLGGKKGGKARMEKLSPEQRKELARKAAQARWKKTD